MPDIDYYEQPEMWENYDVADAISKKTDYIIRHIPSDVRTILDVGCGNGKITNALKDRWQVTGLDLSAEALKHVQTPHVLASATAIPFPDASFDLVISSEMLEHLDNELFAQAIKEMQRVCRRYLLISVPNGEFLPKNQIKCPQCQTVFHSWQHLLSFEKSYFSEQMLAPDFFILNYKTMGEQEQRWIPLLMHIKQRLGKQWFGASASTRCPQCGNSDFPAPSVNLITKVCNGLNRALAGKKPYWQIGLFSRKANKQ